jgi:hypothetical protein
MCSPIEPAADDVSKALSLIARKTSRFARQIQELLLTESAIRWQLCGSSVMAVQIDRLVSLSQLPNIRIGVWPLSVQVLDILAEWLG